jgi:hypothetical protein
VKCYKSIFLLALCISLNCYANFLTPYQVSDIKAGELYWVNIESDKTNIELEKLVNKRIHDVIYVDEYRIEESQKQFHVIVLDAPKKPSEIDKYEFILKGFTYKGLKGPQDPSFIVMDKEHEINKSSKKSIVTNVIIIFCSMLAMFLVLFIISRYRKNSKIKLEFKQKAKLMQDRLNNISNRNDLEDIYRLRNEIKKYIDLDEEEFDKVCEQINLIQFRKDWDSGIQESYTSKLSRIEVMGPKNGI